MELKPLVTLTYEYFFQLANAVVIFLILKHLLFKPVMAVIKAREEDIAMDIQEGKKIREEGEAFKREYEEKVGKAEEEGRNIINSAVEAAKEKSYMIKDDAKRDAEIMKERAKREIEEERIRAMNDMKDEMSDLVILAASKVIEKEIDKDKHKELIDEFIDRTGDIV